MTESNSRANWTAFEREAERIVEACTDEMLEKIDNAAHKRGENAETVRKALSRFAGEDVADLWMDYVADGETNTEMASS